MPARDQAQARPQQSQRQETASSSRKERRPGREQTTAPILSHAANPADCVFNLAAVYPAYPIKRLRARREHRHPKASKTEKSSPLDPLENKIDPLLPFEIGTMNGRRARQSGPPA